MFYASYFYDKRLIDNDFLSCYHYFLKSTIKMTHTYFSQEGSDHKEERWDHEGVADDLMPKTTFFPTKDGLPRVSLRYSSISSSTICSLGM